MLNASGCLSMCVYVVGEHWNRSWSMVGWGKKKRSRRTEGWNVGLSSFELEADSAPCL